MKNNSMLFLASKLQRYLVSNKISIARLAERLEVPKRNLIDLSKGINPRDIVLLKRLANLLNLRLSDIHLESDESLILKEKAFCISLCRSSNKLDLLPAFE